MTTKTKLAILLAVVLALLAVWRGAGAETKDIRQYVTGGGDWEVTKFRDGKVVCWIYKSKSSYHAEGGGIACLPTK